MQKQKSLKRNIMLAACCLCLAGLAGCGNAGNKTSDSGSNEFSYWCGLDANAASTMTSFDEMEIYKEAEKKTGVKIKFIHPAAGQEAEQFNLKIASDSLDDIMEYSWGNYAGGPQQAISDGLILPLNDYLDRGKAPNLKKLIDENPEIAKQMKTDSGEFYAFPAIGLDTVSVTTGYMFRGDWLDELGLKVPETISEWETVLTQFKEKKNAVSPFTGTTANIIASDSFCGAFGCGSGFYLDNGKVKYGPLCGAILECLV